MKKINIFLLGALIMLDINMMAGCKKENTNENQPAETVKTDTKKLGENEDGISIYAPQSILKFNPENPKGQLIHTTYFSKIAEKEKGINILLPPNYSESKKYPVFYLLHGIFGDEYSMVGNEQGGNALTLQNMMNSGEAEEMIVVFPFMYSSKTQPQCSAIDEPNIACYDNFIDELTTSIMPFIKENYSILDGRDNTALGGFSMGGRESLACAFYRPDLFKYVCAMSPAPGLVPGKDFALDHKGQFAEENVRFDTSKTYPDLLLLCCGDSDSVVGTFPLSYHTLFDKNEVKHIWWIIPGSDHGDPAISSGIYNFAKRIFK